MKFLISEICHVFTQQIDYWVDLTSHKLLVQLEQNISRMKILDILSRVWNILEIITVEHISYNSVLETLELFEHI